MKFYYKIIGYEEKKDFGRFDEVTEINVLAETEKEALAKAKKAVVKKGYYVRNVSESKLLDAEENDERRHQEWMSSCDGRHNDIMREVRQEHRDRLDQMERLIKATETKKK